MIGEKHCSGYAEYEARVVHGDLTPVADAEIGRAHV